MIARILLFLIAMSSVTPAAAEDMRVTLGFGRLFSNDRIGDGHDCWRTGSWSISLASGYGWDGARPARFGDIVELRFRTEIIAPGSLSGDGSDDRPYVGALTYGIHSHRAAFGGEVSCGIDVTMTGPQTGLTAFQQRWHERFSAPMLSEEVIAGQIGDGLHPAATAEYGRPFRLSDRALLWPFAELQAGVEQIARIGADVIVGPVAQRDLLLRDQPTGHLYRVMNAGVTGVSFIAVADWARVGDSLWLPEPQGFAPREERFRARVGMFLRVTPRIDSFA